jgi:hypothetical protein
VRPSNVLASRRFSIENLQQQLDSESVAQLMAHQQSTCLEQIREFFGLERTLTGQLLMKCISKANIQYGLRKLARQVQPSSKAC